MRNGARVTGRWSWRPLAFAAIPFALTACVVAPGGSRGAPPPAPAPAPPPRREVRPAPVHPPGADLSGVWELVRIGNQPPGRARGHDEGGPPGQARGRERENEGPPGRAEGPRGPDAGAAWEPRRLDLRQTGIALTILEEGGIPYTIPFDGRPSVVGDPRAGVQARMSGLWHGRRFEARIELSNGTVLTQAYELSHDGVSLTILVRQSGGVRPHARPSQERLVYRRAGRERR